MRNAGSKIALSPWLKTLNRPYDIGTNVSCLMTDVFNTALGFSSYEPETLRSTVLNMIRSYDIGNVVRWSREQEMLIPVEFLEEGKMSDVILQHILFARAQKESEEKKRREKKGYKNTASKRYMARDMRLQYLSYEGRWVDKSIVKRYQDKTPLNDGESVLYEFLVLNPHLIDVVKLIPQGPRKSMGLVLEHIRSWGTNSFNLETLPVDVPMKDGLWREIKGIHSGIRAGLTRYLLEWSVWNNVVIRQIDGETEWLG